MVTSLFSAAESGDVDKVREALKESSSIDIETKDHTGTTPLIAAVKNAHIEVVKELLAAGADPLNPSSQGPPSSHTSDPELLSLLVLAVRPPPVHQQQYPPFNPHHQPPPPHQFQEMGYPPMEMQQGGGYPGFFPPGMFMPQYGMYAPPNGQYPLPPPHHQQQMAMHMQPQHEMQQQQQLPRQVLPGEKSGAEGEVVGENGTGTIPPPDVSKMIPCKFFPDCRYGAECAFLHPPQPAFSPPPAPPPSTMYPQHYQHGPDHFPHPYYQMPPPFGYNGPGPQMRPPPSHVMSAPQQQPPYPFQRHQHQPPHHLSLPDYNNENAFIVVPPPFQPPPNFSPSALATPFAPSPSAVIPAPGQTTSTASPSPPSSPPAQEVPAPSDSAIVPAVSSPVADSAPVTAAAAVEPVVQQQREFTPQTHASRFGPRVGPFGPGAGGFQKKGWLPGGGKKWLGGSAPPCIYFARNLCRNGNICRFPHIQADGTDCRLPGIIDGSLSAAPVSNMTKPAVNRQFLNAADSTSNLESSIESLPLSENSSNGTPQEASVEDKLTSLSVTSLDADSSSSTPTGPRSFSSHIPSAASPAFVPAPRANGAANHLPPFHPNNVNRPLYPHQQPRLAPPTRSVSPNANVSASQHFAQVASANQQQRSSSANPALRRKEDGTPLGGPQQLSQSAHVVKQRIPSSEDFPVLGRGSVGSLRESTGSLGGSVVVVGSGKTAAQVLSGPAPEKAKVAAPLSKKAAQQQQKKKGEEDARSNSSAEALPSSDLSSEDDAVLVAAAKSAPSAPNGAPSPPPLVKKPLSFANAAGALIGAKA